MEFMQFISFMEFMKFVNFIQFKNSRILLPLKIYVLGPIPWLKSVDNETMTKVMLKTASVMTKKEIKVKII